jgi:thiamine kinase-like enzyme
MNINNITKELKKYDFFKNKSFVLKPLKSGNICRTFCMIDDKGNKYLVRINDIFSPCSVKKEVNTIQYLKSKCDYDWIPKLYFYDDDFNVSVTEFYDNCINLADIDFDDNTIDYKSISKQLLQLINELHSIEDNGKINLYEDMLRELNIQTKNAIKEDILTEEEAIIIYQFYDQIDVFKKIEQCFIHTDISADNLIFNKDLNKLHLIDFEFSRVGDKNYDYAYVIKKLNCNLFYDNLEGINLFKQTNIYKFYDLYFELSWYRYNRSYKGISDELKLNEIKQKIINMKEGMTYESKSNNIRW